MKIESGMKNEFKYKDVKQFYKVMKEALNKYLCYFTLLYLFQS